MSAIGQQLPSTSVYIHMKIVLVRHGPPKFRAHWLMPTKGAKRALDLYAASRVTEDMPSGMLDFRSSTNICITSTLARAIDSAKALGFKDSIASDMFNESELPHPNRLLIPVPWSIFLLVFRLLWFCGFSFNCAGKSMDKKRARKASNYLSTLALENRMVMLVGHGIMNRLVCSELIQSGWKIDEKTGSSYWSSITLSRH